MSRPLRLDFHGAIHIVQLRGKERLNIFFDANAIKFGAGALYRSFADRSYAPNIVRFLTLLNGCCEDCSAQLFGYCVGPNDAALVVRILGAPLDAFMQRLSGRYSRYLHAAGILPKGGGAFAARYSSKVVAPDYLPHAVRRVHALPLRWGFVRRSMDYPFSSAAAYLGERIPVRLCADVLWRALEDKGLAGLRGYREFMEKAETPHIQELFERGSQLDARIVGASTFVAQSHDAASHRKPPYTRQQLLAGVATLLNLEHSGSLFIAGSQTVLARALVAWLALNSGSATVREVGTWFDVSAAALGKAIRRYRRISPELFRVALAAFDRDHRADE